MERPSCMYGGPSPRIRALASHDELKRRRSAASLTVSRRSRRFRSLAELSVDSSGCLAFLISRDLSSSTAFAAARRPVIGLLHVGDAWANYRANEDKRLNLQNRGDYFSAIFVDALGGRPRLTSPPCDRRKASRRYSRPPRMLAFFAAASRPPRVGGPPRRLLGINVVGDEAFGYFLGNGPWRS